MAPLDLHVLGTPPAFVLSQDQTLDKIVILNTCLKQAPSILHYQNLLSLTFVLNSTTDFVRYFPNFCHKKLIVLFSSISTTDKNSALFIFQCTIAVSMTAYLYYHIHFSLSTLFLKFFKFFCHKFIFPEYLLPKQL